MKFTWFQSKLTFVIIPEANGSVVRLKLSRAALWSTIFLMLLLIGTICILTIRSLHSTVAVSLKSVEMKGRTAQLEQDLHRKNAAIEQLQNDIYGLSKQAAEVRSQMERMKRLEQDLHKLAPGSAERRKPGGQPVSAAVGAGGMGGEAFPVTEGQTHELAAATGARYTALHAEMKELASRLGQTKRQLQEKQERQQRTPDIWPTLSKIVTSPYGYRKDPFTKKLSFHRGIDIAGKLGDPVYAVAGGVVQSVGYDKLHGHNVVIEHDNKLRTWYMHLNRTQVNRGDRVDKGQTIGQLGTTGRSTGPHLHYEVLLSGKSTDPAPYMPSHNRKKERKK
ncbi:M23 family metallopeptidase [Paenibacillus ehimensis]|uniref:M23 family metallopeptidase n=1 Tax=Paenibacillus ehimensis TaxID=79264 RepID=A0ABT8VK98_9BACL|nr:M23 family metallopeptidase [Paenibacillus ehimensis]MDO3681361.1 M23 family metallopeptidase [Paenibacillus ehimensis]MEC0213611.1 M23 family metallopeptidase [Paenibacillus ehimensis]